VKEIIIIGAGGFAREVLWLISDINAMAEPIYQVNCLIGEEGAGALVSGMGTFPIGGNDEWALKHFPPGTGFVVAIGDAQVRKKIAEAYEAAGFEAVTLIHPSVKLSTAVTIGVGSIICANVVLTVDIEIGRHALINLATTVGHDCRIGDFCTLSPGCHLSGGVHVGAGTELGTGVIVLPEVQIGRGCTLGAGAVVTKNLEAGLSAKGIPARPY
jgi:sugar O-acyltransferase (sialic acid O-acetyltransferase NeuD family)